MYGSKCVETVWISWGTASFKMKNIELLELGQYKVVDKWGHKDPNTAYCDVM